jgi:nickel/cobalt transporter (NicO) family protein
MKAVAVVHAASVSDQLQSLIHSLGVPPLAFALAFVAGAAHAVPGRVTAW